MGKTSLVNVTLYKCYTNFLESGYDCPLFIPCRKRFQLRDDLDPNEFAFEVLLDVAQTLIDCKADLLKAGHQLPKVNEIDRWLNAPEFVSLRASVAGVLGAGFGRSAGALGFSESGFKKTVSSWLEDIFPTDDSGGVICVLDNVEIMRTSVRAREIVEDLRDPVLSLPGLRWMLCGALGFVYGIARSPRLQGILTRPVEVGPITDCEPEEILRSRIEALTEDPLRCSLPLMKDKFKELHELMHGQIRNVLSASNDFCHWIIDLRHSRRFDGKITGARARYLFDAWLREEANKARDDAREQVRTNTWSLFEKIVDAGGISALRDLGIRSIEQKSETLSALRELISVGLLTNVHDTSGETRQMIHVTSKGWFANYAKRWH